MAKTSKSVSVLPATPDQLVTRTKGLQLVQTLKPVTDKLVIVSNQDYLRGDELLGRIRNARAQWGEMINPVKAPLERMKKDLKEQEQAVKNLDQSVDGPLLQLELKVKESMRLFKVEEQRQIREADEERERRAEALRAEARDKALREAQAKSAPLKARLAQQRADLESQAASVEAEAEEVHIVKGGSSVSRSVKRVTISNLSLFLQSLREYEPTAGLYQFGHPPMSLIDVDEITPAITKIYRDQPKLVASWPGVTIEDDIIIAGR